MLSRKALLVVACSALACRSPGAGNASSRAAEKPTPAAVAPSSSAPAPSGSAEAGAVPVKRGFEVLTAVLYQPDTVLAARIVDLKAMAAYNTALKDKCNAFFAQVDRPEVLDVVVALRPQGRARVWLLSSARRSDDAALQVLRAQLESLPAPAVRSGPVAFALLAVVAGAEREKPTAQGYTPPMPPEWTAARDRHTPPLSMPDGILNEVWP